MLEKIDLDKKMGKKEFEEKYKELTYQLGELQRKYRESRIPLIILFEGLDSRGKSLIINNLIQSLDPRGFKFFYIQEPTEEERNRPFLWRFWNKTPSKGFISIMDKSWYKEIVLKRVNEHLENGVSYPEIKAFERQLARDGNVLVKFFIHTSEKNLENRIDELKKENNFPQILKENLKEKMEKYDAYIDAFEEMLESTDSDYAPWAFIEGDNIRFATIKVFMLLINIMESRLAENRNIMIVDEGMQMFDTKIAELNSSILDKVDLTLDLDKYEYEKELAQCQEKISSLAYNLYNSGIPTVILLEGWDAAGKGGLIKRITSAFDPRFYNVIPVGKPNDWEMSHHYLWRFWNEFPKKGNIHIFDRSWYGRVLVERVENLASQEEWKRAYKEINEMERSLVNFGTVVIKFWLHIDQEEQLNRFQEREETDYKQWKITDEDWRNREKWEEYKVAVDEMLYRTSTSYAPWNIIEFNSKRYGRIKAMKKIIEAFEKKIQTGSK